MKLIRLLSYPARSSKTMYSYCGFVARIHSNLYEMLTYSNSVDCQKSDWKVHKRSVCVKAAIFHKVDKMIKKYSGPGTPLENIEALDGMIWAERRRNPSARPERCDGCTLRFRGTPLEDHEEGQGDVGEPFKRCKECDYRL